MINFSYQVDDNDDLMIVSDDVIDVEFKKRQVEDVDSGTLPLRKKQRIE